MSRDTFHEDVFKEWASLPQEARATPSQAETFAWSVADRGPPAENRARYERAMSVIRPYVGKPLSTDP